MRFTFILVCLLCALDAIGQKKKVMSKVEADLIEENSQWYDGSIQLLDDDSKIPGLLLFNDKTQLLSIKLEGGQSEILRPNELKSFEFYDKENQLIRSFVSINYPLIESFIGERKVKYYSLKTEEKTVPLFFEIIKQTKSFMLLCKTDALHLIGKAKDRGSFYQKKYEFGQEVTLYFYDLKEKLYPAIRVTKIETKEKTKNAKNSYYFFGRVSYIKKPDIVLDEKLLSKIMISNFSKVSEYINSNTIDINDVEGLLKTIEYYKHLEDD
jgi:hypothetical protein